MSEALSSIGDFLGSGTGKGLLTGAVGAGGLIQNIIAARQAQAKQNYIKNLLQNPAAFNSLVAGAEQPLSQGLTTDVARQAQAFGAERGLGSSGPVMQDVFAQALAPYQQQEQQMAINSVLQRLGIYANTPTMPAANVSSIFKLLGGAPNSPSSNPLSTMPVPNLPPNPGLPIPPVSVDTGDFGGLTAPIGGGDVGAYG